MLQLLSLLLLHAASVAWSCDEASHADEAEDHGSGVSINWQLQGYMRELKVETTCIVFTTYKHES